MPFPTQITFRTERTGFVRVAIDDGSYVYVEAESFGNAAHKITLAGGNRIRRFDWISETSFALATNFNLHEENA